MWIRDSNNTTQLFTTHVCLSICARFLKSLNNNVFVSNRSNYSICVSHILRQLLGNCSDDKTFWHKSIKPQPWDVYDKECDGGQCKLNLQKFCLKAFVNVKSVQPSVASVSNIFERVL